uniref:palmitoyl-protein hydrolase n=2 Tax=Lygus hesperus TaxID=30085 RepID=A0A0K8T815_LYGHE
MSTSVLNGIDVLEQTGEKATAALIFLHGTGENGKETKEKFVKFMGFMGSGHPYIKVYFPTAKERYLKIRDTVTTFWFNAVRIGPGNEEVDGNVHDANAVTDMIEELIKEIESTGIPRERIAIGGSSQGGMVSIFAAYVRGLKVGAVVGISATFSVFMRQVKMVENSAIPLLSLCGQKDAFIEPGAMNLVWQYFRKHKIPFLPNPFYSVDTS